MDTFDQLWKSSNLSKGQLMCYLGQRIDPDVPLYNMAFAFSIQGEIDIENFQLAFDSVVERSDALRTVFQELDGVPQQTVLPHLPFTLEVHDFPENEPKTTIDAWLVNRTQRVFDLGKRLFDSALIHYKPNQCIWYLNAHHYIIDAWSIALIHHATSEAYASISKTGMPPDTPLPDFQEYLEHEQQFQGSELACEHKKYWESKCGNLESSKVSALQSYTAQEQKSIRVTRTLSRGTVDQIKTLAGQSDIRSFTQHQSIFTLFSTLLVAWHFREKGDPNVTIGTPAHNRPTPAFKRTIGLFIELFPLGTEIGHDETFRSLAQKLRIESFEFLKHAQPGASFPQLHRTFDLVLNYITASIGQFNNSPTHTDWIHSGFSDGSHKLRLEVLDLDACDELTLHFDFNQSSFSEIAQSKAVDALLQLLDAMLANPDQLIAEVVLSPGKPLEILSSQRHPIPETRLPFNSILENYDIVAQDDPGRIAVVGRGEQLTYAQLDDSANQVAHWLVGHGVQAESIIALCVDRSVSLIVGILGILKAGCAYMPIDPADTIQRQHSLIERSQAKAILTLTSCGRKFERLSQPVLLLDQKDSALGHLPKYSPKILSTPEQLAYVLFTSGSTGEPKGVIIEHRNVINLVEGLYEEIYQRHETATGEDQRFKVSLVAPYTFDASVQQIFASLLLGHTLYLVPNEVRRDGEQLLAFWKEHEIQITDGTPSHLRLVLESNRNAYLDSDLLHLIIGGEALPKATVVNFFQKHSGQPPAITNIYGPAECCVDCVAWTVTHENIDAFEMIPLGLPLKNQKIHIVDENSEVVPTGAIGEICISGPNVGRGYLANQALSQESFIHHPLAKCSLLYKTGDMGRFLPGGVIDFQGRRDHQVKIRGYRIELNEIEATLKRYSLEPSKIFHTDLSISGPQRCTRCLLTARHPGVTFDSRGQCSVCTEFDAVKPAVDEYFQPMDHFTELMEQVKADTPADSEFDCMLLYSGGKDSSYVLYRLVEMGLRVLAYTFDNGYISTSAFDNIKRQTEKLGVRSIISKTDNMDRIFLESLNTDHTVCTGCFKALTTISTRLANDYGTRVVITGLSRGQIFDTKLSSLIREGIRDVSEIEHKLKLFRHAFHANQDRATRLLNDDLQDVDLDSYHFVDFFRYDSTPIPQIREYLKERDVFWRQPADTGFCSSNCLMNDIGICVHSAEEGYHNYEAPLSWDIRMGICEREECLAEVSPVQDLKRVHGILKKIGYFKQGINDAVVLDHEDENGNRFLCAYYVSDQTLNTSDLRKYLKRSLPEYMLPARFVRLDSIPLTSNGKVDRKALSPNSQRPDLSNTYSPARNGIETKLAAIWSEVLGIDNIGIHDNFFEVGGDSIRAIQIVAKAGDAGISLKPNHLFSKKTIAELTSSVASNNRIEVDQSTIHGPYPLSPIQRWFFENNFPEINQWNQSLSIGLKPDASIELLENSLELLVQHHDVLRTRFVYTNDWHATIEDHVEGPFVKEFEGTIDDVEKALHNGIDIGKARNIQCGLVKRNNRSVLVMVVHHLVMDAVSWEIFLDGLNRLLRQERSPHAKLPLKTTSFSEWVKGLEKSTKAIPQTDIDYWIRTQSGLGPAGTLPKSFGDGNSEITFTTSLTTIESEKLLNTLPKQLKCQPHELILAAVALSVCQQQDKSLIVVELEGHGREDLVESADSTRSMGWYTTRFPVCLSLPQGTEISGAINTAKKALRELPHKGASYGMIRYLHPDQRVRRSISRYNIPEILFNYLGQAEQLIPRESSFELIKPLSLYRGASNPRTTAIDINAHVFEGKLEISWAFNPGSHTHKSIELYANKTLENLKSLMDSSRLELKFPQANLTQKSLNKLENLISKLDRDP